MDIEDLVASCRTPQSKLLLQEAVGCYHAGSYRSAIVTTWIAVVHDLLGKLRELALEGNGDAVALVAKFDNIYEAEKRLDPDAPKRYVEFERTILEIFRDKFELLTQSETADLARLQMDRHRCAHPTVNEVDEIYKPPAELARLHLRNAAVHVLSRAPAQGRLALEALTKALNSDFFPVDSAAAERALAKGPLRNARAKIVRDFIKFLVHSFFANAATGSKPNPPQAAAAINATLRIHQQVGREALSTVVETRLAHVDDKDLWLVMIFAGMIAESAKSIPHVTTEKIEHYMKSGNDDWIDVALSWALSADQFREMALKRIESFDQYRLAQMSGKAKSAYIIDMGLNVLENSSSFNETNSICRSILMPQALLFGSHHTSRLHQIANENPEVKGGFGYQELLDSIPQMALTSV